MKEYIDYIELSCKSLGNSKNAYLYKRQLLDKMTQRAAEIKGAGMKDEGVTLDLIADELGDFEKGYADFLKELKKKRRGEIMKLALPIGGVVMLLLIFVCYFSVSGITHAWDKSWLIILGGIFALVIFYLSLLVRKLNSMGNAFHPISRVIVAGCIMIFTVFAFLFALMMAENRFVTWPFVPVGVGLMLLGDLLYAYATKQKFRTISFFVYMPAVAAMLYITLAAYGVVTWQGGWPLVFLGLAVDGIYILAVIMHNMKYFMYRQEVDEE